VLLFSGDIIKSFIKKRYHFHIVAYESTYDIPIYLSEWVEPYDLTQYIIFITNISIQLSSEKITKSTF